MKDKKEEKKKEKKKKETLKILILIQLQCQVPHYQGKRVEFKREKRTWEDHLYQKWTCWMLQIDWHLDLTALLWHDL